jgi:hypothetical protein
MILREPRNAVFGAGMVDLLGLTNDDAINMDISWLHECARPVRQASSFLGWFRRQRSWVNLPGVSDFAHNDRVVSGKSLHHHPKPHCSFQLVLTLLITHSPC